MGKRVALNEKRLTRKQVQELIDGGARLREDLVEGINGQSRSDFLFYQLPEDRVLMVPNMSGPIKGKGDIVPLEWVLRQIQSSKLLDEDCTAGRFGSVGHWLYYSRVKDRLPEHVSELVSSLPQALGIDPRFLDLTYPSLDAISKRIEELGVLKVREAAYDHLVAYVGELMRRRVNGEWVVEGRDPPSYPYVLSPVRGKLMPINVVYGELSGSGAANLRLEAANEVRRAQMEGRDRVALGIPI